MIGSKSQSAIRPVALGATVQSSAAGQAIPVIIGRAKSAVYPTWQANVRQGGSKKGKSKLGKGKKGQQSSICNLDLLVGTNPLITCLQFWENQNVRLPLNFVSVSSGTVIGNSFTISDPNFYAVLAVTRSDSYSVTFNDYGGQGSEHLTGSYEIPLWNAALNGPDPTRAATEINPNEWYIWTPAMGATIEVPPCVGGVFEVYYAQLDPSGATQYDKKHSGTAVPAAALKLTWEPVLGDGPEYTGTDSTTGASLSAQQILYPHYAGLGSANFDMGGSALPDIRPEILGAFALYPSGDADFADMIQDIFCSGPGQPGLGAAANLTPVQHGLNCYDWPGAVQCLSAYDVEAGYSAIPYTRPNTAGNFLVVCGNAGSFSEVLTGISDTAGNTWTATLPSGRKGQLWYATAVAAPANAVALSSTTYHWQQTNLELAGVDTFDAVSASTDSSAGLSITTTNAPGTPALLLAYVNGGSQPPSATPPLWEVLTPGATDFFVHYRIVYQPGTYTYTPPTSFTTYSEVVLIAFKATQPNTLPKALGNLLDRPSLDLCRLQCRSNGLWGSLVMDSQQKASDYLELLYQAMNAAPVWSGFRLKSIPYSEVSAVGNGAIYRAPTASGPVAVLTLLDFQVETGEPLYTIERKAKVDVPNILQIQHPNRASDYNDVTIMEPETASIALYGPRKDSPQQMRMIQDPAVARLLLGIQVRRRNYLADVYKFKLKAKRKLLEPMDLVTLPADPLTGLPAVDVRLTVVDESDQYTLSCEAEPFLYGVSAPVPVSVTAAQPYQPQFGAEPANVNPPIFFEPVPRLAGQPNQGQLWIVVSDPSPNYGGCQVFLSTDGGASYNNVGQLTGSAVTGVTVGDWPAASDPDTTNDLAVDLTESNGTLASYQVSDEDTFVYPCYVAGGNASIPYELMAYALANLTAVNQYTLTATGGSHLRRAVFGAPALQAGVDHPDGSRFAFVGQGAPGILKLAMDPKWIGVTLHFKFPVYNEYLGSLESLSDCVDYTYTPTGAPQGAGNPNGGDYTQTPAVALSRTSPTVIAMAAVTEQFPSNAAKYNARTFTIPAPSTPTTYYVTIADPHYLGDEGTSTALTATCQTSNALVGVPGNIYIGFLKVSPAGIASDIAGPGGWPAPFTALVGA